MSSGYSQFSHITDWSMLQLLASLSLGSALLGSSVPTVRPVHTLLSRPFDELVAAAGPDGARHVWQLPSWLQSSRNRVDKLFSDSSGTE